MIRIKNNLKEFEKRVIGYTNNWLVGYKWVKILGELIMNDNLLLDTNLIELINDKCQAELKIDDLLENDWAS